MTVEQWLGPDNEIGAKIWHKKYQHKDETFDQWLERVSGGRKELADLIAEKKFLFGGRTLANRGLDTEGSYFNCYSRGFVHDDYKDIMQAMVDIGLTFKGQGGQGISLSQLRPKGAPIKSEYTSDGIVPFMKMYNEVTVGTSQGGSRKGALMLSIDALHKEADTFIGIKSEQGAIEGANLSLEIDDEFMLAVEKYYTENETVVLHIKKNYSGHEIEYDVTPIEVFKHLVDNSYDWGDPACLFVNRFRNYNLMQFDDDYQIETSNPCGEQPLPKHGACCLGSINLSEFIKKPYTEQAFFDSEGFVIAVREGIRALDSMIDENYMRHPLPEQQRMSHDYRNIGLGIFGYMERERTSGLTAGTTWSYSKILDPWLAQNAEKYSFTGTIDELIATYKRIYQDFDAYVRENGLKTIKSCKAYSLEYEFVEKKISLEEDTYELSDGLAEENTLLGIILEKMPSWRKGTVSQTLIGKYRTFETSAQSLYDFMKSTLQEKFRCVFDFDTYTRTVNIVDVNEFVPTRQVFLSLDNLLKKVDVSENADNIVTCLGVYGADGVDIYSVNPLGTDKIYNLDYLFQSGQIREPAQPLQDTDDSFGAKWRRWEAQLSASQQKFYSLSVEQSVHTANSLAQNAILLRLDGELTGLEAIKASYVSAIAQGLEKDSSTGSYFSDLMPQIDSQIAAKQAEIAKAKERKALSDQYVQSATDSMKEIQDSCKFETFFTDYVCPICGHVAKTTDETHVTCEHCGTVSSIDDADSELLVLNRYFREDTLTDESFVERTVKANNDNDRSGAVGDTTVKIASATITMTHSDDVHKDTYTISGGTLVLQTVKDGQTVTYTAAKVRSAAIVHNLSDDTYVLSAFLGAGYVETETMTGGNATISGTWGSLSGDLQADPEVQSDNYKIGTAIEISASDNTWYFTTDTSKYESLSISNELYQYGKECLRQMAFPTYTFSIESGNFLSMHECELFKNQLSLGKRIYLDLDDDEVLEPICTGASFSFDDLRSLKLEFSDTYSGSDKAMSLAGLLEESVSMGHTVASSKGGWNAYQDSGASSAVRDLMTQALDVAKNKVLSSTMQAISWDESGIRLRKWLDSSKTSYEDTQIWMTDQNIVFTDDNWQTAKMAIGKLSTKKYGDVFGVCAPYLVGTILAGENLAITNRNGNFLIDDEGIKVNGLNFFISSSNIVEPTDSVDSVADLPSSANEGDLCSVGKDTYKYTSGVWKLYIKVVSKKTDLPSSGPEDSQTLYKVEDDGSVWQWNNSRWEEYSLPLSEYIQGSLGEITGKDDNGNAFVKADKISGIINAVQAQMSSCGGNMLFDEHGLWLIDSTSPSTANKAVWLNQSGIMLSKSRNKSDSTDPSYNSDTRKSFEWKTAITSDGIAAEYLTGEYLHAGFEISVGSPSSGTSYSTCPFYVDSDGYLSCRGASISGAIRATSLDVTNATVTGLEVNALNVTGTFSASKINGGILDFNNFSVNNLSANSITTGSFTADRIQLGGDMAVYDSTYGGSVGGWIGYTTGTYGGAGIHMQTGSGEVVATTSGAKLCYGNNTLSVTSGGAQTNCGMALGGSTTVSGSIAPAYDCGGQLGYSDYRWSVVYAQTSTISTSDRAQKKDISYDMEKYDSLFKKLKPTNYKMKDGTSNRTHTGLIAQDVEQALKECGLTGQDFAAFVRTPRDDGDADYGMRYEELIALCIYEIHKLQAKIEMLEGKE